MVDAPCYFRNDKFRRYLNMQTFEEEAKKFVEKYESSRHFQLNDKALQLFDSSVEGKRGLLSYCSGGCSYVKVINVNVLRLIPKLFKT